MILTLFGPQMPQNYCGYKMLSTIVRFLTIPRKMHTQAGRASMPGNNPNPGFQGFIGTSSASFSNSFQEQTTQRRCSFSDLMFFLGFGFGLGHPLIGTILRWTSGSRISKAINVSSSAASCILRASSILSSSYNHRLVALMLRRA